MDSFDYVIVGGGSAGSLLAGKLVQSGASVCLLEAGPVDSNPFIHIPAGFVKTLFNKSITWPFQTQGTHWTDGRSIPTTQGRTLGGSSSINGMVFVRGQPADFDAWAKRGNKGWDYASVLPYFRRLERRIGSADEAYRGRDGSLPVTDTDWRHPLCDAFIAGAQSLGIQRNVDYNGAVSDGTGYYQRVIFQRRRVSSARAFLHPQMNSSLLEVRTNAQATAIVLEGKKAVGVKYTHSKNPSTVTEVRAQREVIVACGAINSPKLLQLSGIGSRDLLSGLGIPVLHDLPGVGEHLSDHYSPRIVTRAEKGITTINNLVKWPRLLGEGAKWMFGQPSVLSISVALAYAFGKSRPDLDRADSTIIFSPASYRAGKLGSLDKFAGMTCGTWQMRPESL